MSTQNMLQVTNLVQKVLQLAMEDYIHINKEELKLCRPPELWPFPILRPRLKYYYS